MENNKIKVKYYIILYYRNFNNTYNKKINFLRKVVYIYYFYKNFYDNKVIIE